MTAKQIAKGILKLRLTSCLSTNPEILQFTPAAHVIKVRQKVNMHYKGRNYEILPTTPRQDIRREAIIEKQQKHSIWLTTEHGTPRCSIEEALIMHMEYADPSMLNNMDGCVFADMELDMSTKKKTKFMKSKKDLLEFPNHFEYGPPKKIAVFCFTPEDVAIAKEYGVMYCGGEELVREFATGLISKDAIGDLDFILATPDNVPAILTLRSTLRDRLPKLANNTLHSDLRFLLDKYTKGVIYNITKPAEEIGKAQIPIGKMSQGLVSLVENFEFMVDQVSSLKPKAKNVAPLIKTISVIAPPSHEQFQLKVEDYVTGYVEKHKPELDEELPEEQEEAVLAAR